MKKLKDEVEDFYTVISITENKELAQKLIKFFLVDYTEEEQKEILTELENRDSRFKGWNCAYIVEYTYGNITGDMLYLGRAVARKAKEEKRQIKVFFY
jgi:ABC-type thiamine transport system substrate-binding protein